MTRIRNVQGKITETTGGNDISYAQESIVLNSHKAISIKGEEKGVSFQKPKSYKPKTDLLVTKIEGPYDEKDKLVKVVKKGDFYTYKASLSREPKPEEIKMLRWASKNDDGKVNELLSVSTHNALVKEKIIIGIAVNQDCEKVRIYAYYKKADEKTSVEATVSGFFHAYIIAKSRHRKGLNEEGTGTHHDMMSKDMTDQEIIALNPDTKKWIDIVNKEGYEGIKKLAVEMEDLLTDFSTGDLEDVNVKLYKKFVGNKPGDFSDPILTQAAVKHEHTDKFFARVKENMKTQLNSSPDFVFQKELLVNHEVIDKKKATQRIDIPSPSYPDKYGGLGISVNDTWGYDMKITRFEQDTVKRTYSADFEVEIFDHYGLNSEDIDPKVKGGFFGSASFEGFLCWFILQHKCGYKPFYTIIKMKKKIDGTY